MTIIELERISSIIICK